MILSDEFLKLKRINGMHMIYIFPLLMCFIQVYEILKASSSNKGAILNSAVSNVYVQLYSLFAAFATILLTFTIIQVENKNNMWESNLMLPISKSSIFLKKIFISIIVLFLFTLFSYCTYILGIFICNYFYDINFSLVENQLLLIFFSKMFLAFVLYSCIAVPLFIFIESSVISIGSMIFLLLVSLFLTKKEWFEYYPFSYHIIAQYDLSAGTWLGFVNGDFIISGYIVLTVLLGTIFFKKIKK